MSPGYLVAFASLNQVALLKRALQRQRIFVAMQRTPRRLAEKGCGFAIRCGADDLPVVLDVCRESRLEPAGVFSEAEAFAADAERTFSDEEVEG